MERVDRGDYIREKVYFNSTPVTRVPDGRTDRDRLVARDWRDDVGMTMLGQYGDLANKLLADDPKALSFRRPEFREVGAWRDQARARVAELLAAPEAGSPTPEMVDVAIRDGLETTRLRWQLPYGPPAEALLLKPQGAVGPLPGVLALHDHGGLKYFGWRKIADDGAPVHPVVRRLREDSYGGRAWANELARRGYVVLCHDVFLWGSRRIRLADVPERVRWNGAMDPRAETEQEVRAYNDWASAYENLVAKSLLSAGTTLPGVILAEDQAALGVLCAQPEVDQARVACAGLSGGGLRTVYLAGMDPRVRAAMCIGLMSTWRDPIFFQCDHWTWMMFARRGCRASWSGRRCWGCTRRHPCWYRTTPRISSSHWERCSGPTRYFARCTRRPGRPTGTAASSTPARTSSTPTCRRPPSAGWTGG